MAYIHRARSKAEPVPFWKIAEELNRKGMKPASVELWRPENVCATYNDHLEATNRPESSDTRAKARHKLAKKMVLDLHAKGVKVRVIADKLAEAGHTTLRGHKYCPRTVRGRLVYWTKK